MSTMLRLLTIRRYYHTLPWMRFKDVVPVFALPYFVSILTYLILGPFITFVLRNLPLVLFLCFPIFFLLQNPSDLKIFDGAPT